MTKNLIIISLLFLLSNCGISSSALLGPTYTGVKTGSVYQTSLSYSSGKVINQIKSKNIINLSKLEKNLKKKYQKKIVIPYTEKNPVILLAHKVNKIQVSDVYEPEPLP